MNKRSKQENSRPEDEKFPLPIYKKEEDIYNKEKEEALDDEGILLKKKSGETDKGLGEDLDVPGAETDDGDEAIGEEDEENNYYSLGGDEHNDLEEDQG